MLKEEVYFEVVLYKDHGVGLKDKVCSEVVLWVVTTGAGSRGASVGEKVGTLMLLKDKEVGKHVLFE